METAKGLGLGGVLTVIFVIAKLMGAINWSWWWVFSPLLFGLGIALAFFVVMAGGAALFLWLMSRKR